MPIWKAWRIARDLSTLDRQTILLDSAHKVIELKNVALNSAQLALNASDSAYLAKENEAKECRNLNDVSKQIHAQQLKSERKKGFKLGALVTGSGFLGVILLVMML